MNNALLYLGGLLSAILVALFAGPHFIDWNSYRGVFEEEASAVLNREVRVSGPVSLRLLPSPYVSFEKVRISDAGSGAGGSIIRAESFTMWLSVPPLLRGLLEASRIELRKPILQLAADTQGGGNWQSLAVAQGNLPFLPKDVTLQSVSIIDGAINFIGPDHSDIASIDRINGELSADSLAGPFRFKGALAWDSKLRNVRLSTGKRAANGEMRFKAAVEVPQNKNNYILDAKLVDTAGVLKLDGELTARLAVGSVSGQPAPTAQPMRDANTENTAKPAASDIKAQIPAGTSQASTPNDIQLPRSSPEGAWLELRSKLVASTSSAELTDLSVTLDDGSTPQTITGSAKLAWLQTRNFDIKFSSTFLDLDRLDPTAKSRVPLDRARALVSVLANQLPAQIATTATLEFDQLTLGAEPISKVRLSVKRDNGPFEIKEARATLPGNTQFELTGLLTANETTAPRIDGMLYLSGQSMVKFLTWAFNQPDTARDRTDAPFVLDSKFALSDTEIEFTDATVEAGGLPVQGEMRLNLGTRKRVAIVLEGPRIDAGQVKSGMIGVESLKGLLFGDVKPGAAERALGLDLTTADFSILMHTHELVDGPQTLRDVEAEVSIEDGKLNMPYLRFTTAEGLIVDANGRLTGVPTQPKGSVHSIVTAPTADAGLALIRFLVGPTTALPTLSRVTGLVPLRVAARVTLAGDAGRNANISLDGTIAGGHLTANGTLAGERDLWRKSPIDLSLNIDGLAAGRILAPWANISGAALGSQADYPARLAVKIAGHPEQGMLALAELKSESISTLYRGRVTLQESDVVHAEGNVAISARDGRDIMALARLPLGPLNAGANLAGNVKVDLLGNELRLETADMQFGLSKLAGTVTVSANDDGSDTINGNISTDRMALTALLAPVLDRDVPAPPPAPTAATTSSTIPPAKFATPQPLRPTQPIISATPTATNGTPAPTSAEASLWPEQKFNFAELKNKRGSIKAQIGSLILEPGLALQDTSISVDFNPNGVVVSSLTSAALGGAFQAAMKLEKATASAALSGDIRIDITSPPTPGTTPALPSTKQDATNGDIAAFKVNLAGRAQSPALLVSSLTGTGELAVGALAITGISPQSINAVVEQAISGKGPMSGAPLMDALRAASKQGEFKLGTRTIPVSIADGALRLDKINTDAPEGRSTMATALDLATFRLDHEWIIEPAVAAAGDPSTRFYMPGISVIYTGKVATLSAIEPTLTIGGLERELSVRKVERELAELERLRRADEARAAEEKQRREAAEAAALAAQQAARQRALANQPQQSSQPLNGSPTQAPPVSANQADPSSGATLPADAAPAPSGPQTPGLSPTQQAAQPPPPGAPASTAGSAQAATNPAPRRPRPTEEKWRPFQQE